MTGFPISLIIDRGIDLYQFDDLDWVYDETCEFAIVREGSKLYTFLTLALL